MRPVTFTVNLDAASTTKVAAAQTVLINGSLTLAAAASAIDSSGAARILLITTTENDSAGNLTITGTDADNNSISEVIAMPNSTTKVTTKAYKSVSSIVTDLAITANISIGTVSTTLTALSATVPLDFYAREGATVVCEHSGTIVYTVQETFDEVMSGVSASAVWFNGSLSTDTQNTSGGGTVGANLLSISSADARSQLDKGVTGCRVSVASYSSGATLTVRVITASNSNMG